MVRKAMFAGSFYPGTKEDINRFIEKNLVESPKKYDAISIMVPHAGYLFSGKTAISVYSSINIPEKVIVIGPNHTGIGASLSVMTEGVWKTPSGNAEIDTELAENILLNSKHLKADISAHINEHSIEVQIPIMFYFNKNFKFVPIVMGNYSLPVITDLASAISKVAKEKVLVIASSDMSHYVPRRVAKELDAMAFEKIENLDPSGLMKVIYEYDISMCGSGPMAVAIEYAKGKNAKEVILIDYTDSGNVTNDIDSVVSYAGFIIA